MSLITYEELLELVDYGVIEGVDPSHINAASIDVTLGKTIWFEDQRGGRIWLANKESPGMIRHDLESEGPYCLSPGEFVLAQTREVFDLPEEIMLSNFVRYSISAEFRLKSSTARSGLDQALAVWCDPGWNGSVLTMELRNNLGHHKLVLEEGMKIGQMVFWKGAPVPKAASYASRGRYNQDKEATQSKGVR